jgi:citrate/tricarballylate utilization protein
MLICNACRYCEGYCAVFRAMEQRRAFPAADLRYLANLCHNCGECLYACQYAPPHEFAVNVPRTLAEIRLDSYESYAWPAVMARVFRWNSVGASLALSAVMIGTILALTRAVGTPDVPPGTADFYAVLPHDVMVGLFGAVFAFALAALGVGLARFRRDAALRGEGAKVRGCEGAKVRGGDGAEVRGKLAAVRHTLRDVLTLTYLHGHGADCTYGGEEVRGPWRRWFHHCTFFGFLLCFASTSVAAVYHWLGWQAPYDYASLPVALGAAGGLGLLVGPAGLLAIGRVRDPAAGDPAQRPFETGFTVLLFLSSLTGLALLVLRATQAMPLLLVVHLGVVLALFVTLPYSKFVHGMYRTAALLQYAQESEPAAQRR